MKIVGLLLLVLLVVEGVRLVQLRRSIEGYSVYWQNRAAEPAADNALTYIALGDSVAQGIGATQPEKGYVGLLATAIEEKTGRPVQVINLSVSGARLQDVIDKQLPQLSELPIGDKTIITLDIGANDMKNYDEAVFARQFEMILKNLPPQTIVADVPYFGPDFHRHGGAQARQANQIVEPLLARYNFQRAPAYKFTRQRNGILYYAADFFHPSNRGHQSWFMAFWPLIEQQLEQQS